ncbi:MAG: glycosyltransferase [Elusimicrobia bacterium]|nr:glycosyltransferase [Elusimicrobiota bacterium]
MSKPRRIALLPGTSLEDPTYRRLFDGLESSLRPLGFMARAFSPDEGGETLDHFSPDMVHLHFTGHLPGPCRRLLARSMARGARLALTFQDLDNQDRPARTAGQTRVISDLVDRAFFVSALTPAMALRVVSNFPQARGKIASIGNGVGPEWFQPRSGCRTPSLVSIARLSPYKGTDILLWAFRELLDAHPEARLTLFGEDFQNGHFQGLAEKLGLDGYVEFKGLASAFRLKAALKSCRLFAFTSRDETYGMALLEAMAAAAPIVASATGAAALFIEHKKSGWLCTPGDWKSLARGMKALWRDESLGETLGRACREVALSQTWERRASEYARLYAH